MAHFVTRDVTVSQELSVTRGVVHQLRMDCYVRSMSGHYIKEWRKHRGLSQRRLAERMEVTPGDELISAMSLSRIERFEQPYSQPILEALSMAFNCSVSEILSVNPLVEGEVVDLVGLIKQHDEAWRARALKVLRALEAG